MESKKIVHEDKMGSNETVFFSIRTSDSSGPAGGPLTTWLHYPSGQFDLYAVKQSWVSLAALLLDGVLEPLPKCTATAPAKAVGQMY